MEIDPAKAYKYLSPRMMVLVTTKDKENNVDAEPFSFVTPVSMKPPLIAVSIGAKQKTLKAIRETRQFVINVPSDEMLPKLVGFLDKSLPEDLKFEKSGINQVPANKVMPPMIYECVMWFECLLEFEKEAGDHVIVVGRVVDVSARDNVLAKDGSVDVTKARPLLHIMGMRFTVPEKETLAKKEGQQ